ncbi:MFS transporter [Pseudomonas sp. SbB1]|nr:MULTISPECIES: MFS transporter [Pseudomonas]MBP0708920.1 MFS transporter [Pseudomonas sp. T34]MCK2188359.1 MFS transporter [Pseudomonas sp. MB04B]MDD2083974.1 MFS transporter [Pseudomonas putida]MDD2093124.1 MFS transporter [Pseudomonas putida]NOG88351.1 MFS transporter [Pseudomonas sp. SbB1]
MSSPAIPLQYSSRHVWSAVLAMSLCAFALVASEFLPVSLLTPIASDLSLTEGQAGQAISISGFFAVITSLLLVTLTQGIDRKPVLLTTTALMLVSGAMVAFAPNYLTLMVGRAVLGIAIGGYWSMSTAVMMRIAPGALVPKAIAVMQGGTALATAIAAPIGSYLGGMIGWRGAFFCVVPLAALALIWQAFTLPRMPSERTKLSVTGSLRLLGDSKIAIGMAAVAFLFMGQFTLFTYLRPFLETVTHVDVPTLSLLLLIIGAAGLLGTLLVGPLVSRTLNRVLVGIPIIMSAIAFAAIAVGSSVIPLAVLLGLWGLIATCAPVGWFTWLAKALPHNAEAGGGLMVAVIQLAITAGATVGGLLYDGIGYQAAFIASGTFLFIATLLSVITSQK